MTIFIILRYFILFLFIFIMFSFNENKQTKKFLIKAFQFPKIYGWYHEQENASEDEIHEVLSFFHDQGVECIYYMTEIEKYSIVTKISKNIGIQIYAWIPALIGTGINKKWIHDNHPEVYAVNKLGKSSYYNPLYGLSHYKFLCNASKIENLTGINLDYIRYAEVNIINFAPDGETCYCEYFVSDFFNKTGINITQNDQPNKVDKWNSYRINVITSLVNELAEIVHSKGLLIHSACPIFKSSN